MKTADCESDCGFRSDGLAGKAVQNVHCLSFPIHFVESALIFRSFRKFIFLHGEKLSS